MGRAVFFLYKRIFFVRTKKIRPCVYIGFNLIYSGPAKNCPKGHLEAARAPKYPQIMETRAVFLLYECIFLYVQKSDSYIYKHAPR